MFQFIRLDTYFFVLFTSLATVLTELPTIYNNVIWFILMLAEAQYFRLLFSFSRAQHALAICFLIWWRSKIQAGLRNMANNSIKLLTMLAFIFTIHLSLGHFWNFQFLQITWLFRDCTGWRIDICISKNGKKEDPGKYKPIWHQVLVWSAWGTNHYFRF